MNKKTKKRKTAKDYGDKTPKDYDREMTKIRKKAKKEIEKLKKMKTRSISIDLKLTHKGQSWEQSSAKKRAKRKYGLSF